MRILNVAAFAVSGYASTEGRICKPFNPLLGETYEADYPDKGLRFFSEKVFGILKLALHYSLIFLFYAFPQLKRSQTNKTRLARIRYLY